MLSQCAFALSEGSLVPELLMTVTAASPDAAVSSTVAAGLQTDFVAFVMPACAGLSLSASCKSLYSQKQFSAVSTPKTATPDNAQTCATTFLSHNQQGGAEVCSAVCQQQDTQQLLKVSQLTCHSCLEAL